MIYPKKATQDIESKKKFSKEQRDQLKGLLGEKFAKKYPDVHPDDVNEQVNKFLNQEVSITSEKLRGLERDIFNHNAKEASLLERDDLSVKSGLSKMSGATDFQRDQKDKLSTGRQTITIDFMPNTKTNLKYQSNVEEEQEWAQIYKHNNTVYKDMDILDKIKAAEDKIKFKKDLDKQVDVKVEKKKHVEDLKKIELDQVNSKVKLEEQKEKAKLAEIKAKIMYEKEMRDKQLKEIQAARKADIKQQKAIDKFIIQQIRVEQEQEQKAAVIEKHKQAEQWRKVLEDNEIKNQIAREERERERQENIRLMEENAKLEMEKEKARELEFREKEARIRRILESGTGLIGKPVDERERKQEEKVKKWEEKKEKRLKEEELREKEKAFKKKIETRENLFEQMREKEERRQYDHLTKNEQAKIWNEEAEKYSEWEKNRSDYRREQMKVYSGVLKQQMQEKYEEKKANSLLLQLRAAQYEKKPGQ